jgi:hypothetical protein
MRVLKDERENPVLRGRCAGLLDLGDSGQTAGAARVWASTRSGEVKFAIEVAFLRHSDADYKRLQPSVGPVTTIVRSWPDRWPVQTVPDGKIRFWGTSHLSRAFLEAYEHDMTSPDKVNFGFTLKNRATQKQLRFRLQDISDTGDSRYGYVDLDRETALPAGHYALAFIYTWDGKVVSSGHGMDIRVVASKAGNVIEAPPSSSMD